MHWNIQTCKWIFGPITCLMISKKWFTNTFDFCVGDNFNIYSLIIIINARLLVGVWCGIFKMSKLSHLTIHLSFEFFFNLPRKKKESVKTTKGFSRKQWTQVATLWRKKVAMYLDYCFQQVINLQEESYFLTFPILSFSQIFLCMITTPLTSPIWNK